MNPAPDWWEWEFELDAGGHTLDRMSERGFNETDLWEIIEQAIGCVPDAVPGRYVLATRFDDAAWEVIVEPDGAVRKVIVVTAYKVLP
jgi:hypothetical protein